MICAGQKKTSEDSLPPPDFQKLLWAYLERYRYSALGELLKGVVHNLNGSLQILSMQMELLQRMLPREEDPLQEQMEKCLGQIEKFKMMLDLLIQKGVRDEQDAPEPIHLNEVLQEELSLLHHNLFFKHQVRMQKNLSPRLPLLKGMYTDFSQALANLIQNSLEAMENSDPKELSVATEAKGDRILVRIQDSGCGIPEEIQSHLFQPFFSTKGGKHQGIGLYVARELLQPYGASLHYSSRKGETIWEVIFPLQNQPDSKAGASHHRSKT